MGQAKRRKQQLGDLYGTPQGSNRQLIAYEGFEQEQLDQKALTQIQAALSAGQPVVLIGTASARPLATAAGLPWLHELPTGEPVPNAVAWDPAIAEEGGPLLPVGQFDGGLTVFSDGFTQWLEQALTVPI